MITILGGPIPIVAHTPTALPSAAQAGVAMVLPAQPVAPVMATAESSHLEEDRRRDSQQRQRERRGRDGQEANPSSDNSLGQMVDTEI